MINLNDETTWPKINSYWQHHNGNIYEMLLFTNIETARQDEYPTTIVYSNIDNLKIYSRKLVDWERSMKEVNK